MGEYQIQDLPLRWHEILSENNGWEDMREADAKPKGNHAGVVESVRPVILAGVFGGFKALRRF